MASTSNIAEIERRLWDAADDLRANSKLKSSEYSIPVLGLIFLRYADYRFEQADQQLKAAQASSKRPLPLSKARYQAAGVLYLPDEARFSRLLWLPEGANIGAAINDAMRAIEHENDELKDVLPKTYNRLENSLLVSLLKTLSSIPPMDGDAFGRIYEYFLGKFAMSEGQKGGEFYTPISLVRLIVEIIEPFHGRIFDPSCGSGGMFVQSANFVKRHQKEPGTEISIYGQEKVAETTRLCRMNLAVHGLSGEIKQGNTYYEDLHRLAGRFDFVMANPPFNVDRVDKERIKDDTARFPFGMPTVDNANYLWIQLFYAALNGRGRAGFVMANSASDARGSEQEIRKKLIEAGAVDVMVAVGSNFFYTVTLPCTLWFFDRGKPAARTDTVLFIDARQIFTQVSRALREWSPAQGEFLANIARLYRGEPPETANGSADLLAQHFPDGSYRDLAGLCKVATRAEIAAQGWSLNPGRYVGVAARAADEFDFAERLEELNEELARLNSEARELEERIAQNVELLLNRSLA
ncbi:MAG: class I SAM-dependent DNA methyltransferase [Roseiflexaceae bacterium]